ncbi:MAG: glycosyltransferase family 2 protein [Acidimicrobiia bacterium]|nr:glycosyltransferase family 2 protein [Acidimicrobiia bacterium]
MLVVVFIVVVVTTSYAVAAFLRSRRPRPEPLPAPDRLFFVFVVPCLNEELVIEASLDRLLGLPSDNVAVLVVDDGSDDRTAALVEARRSDRVWLVRRFLPEARKGKGAALNYAFRYLRESGVLDGRRPEDVIVVVMDADGRIGQNALVEVAPYFADPKSAAVQIGVRMYNREVSLIARMQDLEFVTFTHIFQRARQRTGSIGLGGNGQFNRLTALADLGDEPWTDCLTEDLDLGVRFLLNGWVNHFCPTADVSQQAVTSVRRLLRQRARWFQGHLQCWRFLPTLLRPRRMGRAQANELAYHLSSPVLVLGMTPPVVAFLGVFAALLVTNPGAAGHSLIAHEGLGLAIAYVLGFGLASLYAFVYWLSEDSVGLGRAFAYAHLYCLYGYLWFPAGWTAVTRVLRRRQSWWKTARTADANVAQ